MSKQVQELLDGAGAGRWILPSPDEPNPVSLARAVGAGNVVSVKVADHVSGRCHSLIADPVPPRCAVERRQELPSPGLW